LRLSPQFQRIFSFGVEALAGAHVQNLDAIRDLDATSDPMRVARVLKTFSAAGNEHGGRIQ
jgi:hypothetical protein